ncbi:MAG: tetratricopeptide repeat protein [Planctomycetaceae bacterium]
MRAFSIAGMVWLRSVCLVWIGLGWIGLGWASVAWAQGPGGWHGPGGYSGHGQWNGPQGSGVGWSGNWTGNAGGAWSGRGVGLWSGTAGWTNTWPGGWGGYSSWGPAGGWNVYPGPVISYPAWGYTSAAPIFVDPEVMGFGPRPPRLLPLLGPEVGEQLRNLGREEWVAPGLRRGAGPGAAVPGAAVPGAAVPGAAVPGAALEGLPEGGAGAAAPAVPLQPDQENPQLFLKRSNPEQQLRAQRAQLQGDQHFQRADYLSAAGKYRQATQAAADLPGPRIRLGMALAGLGEFRGAARAFKMVLQLEPRWPEQGPSLDELFGPDNDIAKNTVLQRALAWTKADIRDPDRLLVMGVLLWFNEDLDAARKVLTTAVQLTEGTSPAVAFLKAGSAPREASPVPVPAPPRPPVNLPPVNLPPQPAPADAPIPMPD